jgi:hypothetical protein
LTAIRLPRSVVHMLKDAQVAEEIAAYRLKLDALLRRFEAGERTTLELEAQAHADALICMMEEAPFAHRPAIDYLVDRYEALRGSCLN